MTVKKINLEAFLDVPAERWDAVFNAFEAHQNRASQTAWANVSAVVLRHYEISEGM
ncbi:MAG: hypothetical protein P8L68_11400 [Paracoccaceae bacterium]|nr:hypothetical protein [Paracoccaceae bacterium]MDG2259088.1 hypothetical protein [Paracoccaceae bacterium]